MSEDYGKALGVLLKYEVFAEQNSASDRAKLHNIEYQFGGRTFWVWAEIEIASDSIRGIAHSCMKSRWRRDMSKEEAASFLADQSIFDKEHLLEWIGYHGAKYPDFLRYMLASEGVRIAAVKYLRRCLEGPGHV